MLWLAWCGLGSLMVGLATMLRAAVPTAASDWAARVTSRVADVLGEPGVPSSRQRVCVVHNAALMEKDSALDPAPPDVLRRALELNVVVPQQLNALLLPSMGVGSSILYVGSTLSEKAVAGAASYATAKHAMLGAKVGRHGGAMLWPVPSVCQRWLWPLHRAIHSCCWQGSCATCQDLAVTPGACEAVHTAAVCPGFVDTPMLREHLGWAAAEEAEVRHSNPAPPLPRIIVPPPRRPSRRRQTAHRACLCACYPAWAAGGIYICREPCTYVSGPPSPSVGLCAARVWIAVAGALRARLVSPGQRRPGGGQAAAPGGGGPSGVRAADQPGGGGGDAVLVRGPATHQRRHLACQPRPD
eukprot:COSAG01_NODE_12_length_41732_cov_160.472964_24_plen_356_part_00